MITRGAAVEEIKQYAVEQQGMSTLKKSALELVQDGTTTIEELLRVAYYDYGAGRAIICKAHSQRISQYRQLFIITFLCYDQDFYLRYHSNRNYR